jgi:GDP/UDP-N,N'-diacetylbacillosamine 2-epimerase (hydrolysing)
LSKLKDIAFFTSIRSEYGVMIPFLKKIQNNPSFNLKLLVGGAHLSNEHGNTIDEIINDGFCIDCKFPFLNEENSAISLIRAMATLQLQIGEYFASNKPDILIVVGDRFELLPVVFGALVLGIPIAHLSGGDVTEGVIDNQIRHAISKISHLHFTGTESSKNNLLKMGEEEWRVYNVGEPGIDCIFSMQLIDRKDLYLDLNLDESKPVVITTFHPETISNVINAKYLNDLFTRLLKEFPTHQFLVTASNFDLGGSEINNTFKRLSNQSEQIKFVSSLGQKRYYSLMKYADFMLGNSSSGIIEAQSFWLPVINIGTRQDGRERNVNTLDVRFDIHDVISASRKIQNIRFRNLIRKSENIYGNGRSADKIIKCFETIEKEDLSLKKSNF